MKKITDVIFSKEYIKIYIILILIILARLLIIEPFRIPSGSMKPTILVGDFIFANKFIYGIKIPFINKKININCPERGDIILFKNKNKKKYIKRVIGIENEKILYKDKKIKINNLIIKNKKKAKKIKINKKYKIIEINYKKEYLTPKKEYLIQEYKNINKKNYPFSNVIIPKKSYFVLGDNRDNSEDSRFWGFVGEKQVIGKALFIWLSINYKTLEIRWERLLKKIK